MANQIDKIANLTQNSKLELEKDGVERPKEGSYRNNLSNINDTFWSHNDAFKMLAAMATWSDYERRTDILCSSGLVTAALMPFAVPFPELCLEVGKNCDFTQKALFDTQGKKILDFTPEGIEAAFGWKKEGESYTQKQSQAFYDKMQSKRGDLLKQWMEGSAKRFSGQQLIKAKRQFFLPTVSKIISLLSRVTGKEDDLRFRTEFTGFIDMISREKRIRWSVVISEALTEQLSQVGITKSFHMNTYLVYLLLHGRTRSSARGDLEKLANPDNPVWGGYDKWWLVNRWRNYTMRHDGWEYCIYKEIKGTEAVKRISDSAIAAIKRHADFFCEDPNHTYIRVYGSGEKPYLLPKYASDRLVLLEFMRHMLFLKERIWKKKFSSVTIKKGISIGEYGLSSWKEAESMKKELELYDFKKTKATPLYDPEGIMDDYCRKKRKVPFLHETLGDLERYRNLRDPVDINRVHSEIAREQRAKRLAKGGKEKAVEVKKNLQRRRPPSKSPTPELPSLIDKRSLRRRQGVVGPRGTSISPRPLEATVEKVQRNIEKVRRSGNPDFPLDQLEQAAINTAPGPNREGNMTRPVNTTLPRHISPSSSSPTSSSPSSSSGTSSGTSSATSGYSLTPELGEIRENEGGGLEERSRDSNEASTSSGSSSDEESSERSLNSEEQASIPPSPPVVEKRIPEASITQCRPSSSRASKKKRSPTPQQGGGGSKRICQKPSPKSKSKRIVSNSGGSGDDNEDEGENEEQRKKRRQEEHEGNEEIIIVDEEPGENIEETGHAQNPQGTGGAEKNYGFDLDACIKMLQMDFEDEETAIVPADGTLPRQEGEATPTIPVDTYITMGADQISIHTVGAKKREPQGLDDLRVNTQVINVGKIGPSGRKHAISSNAAAFESELLQSQKTIRQLKKELTGTKKLVKEVEAAGLGPEELKKQALLRQGLVKVRETATEGTIEVVKKLTSLITNFSKEEERVNQLKGRVDEWMIKVDANVATMLMLRINSEDNPERMSYCEDYLFYLDWMKYAVEKCGKFIAERTELKKVITNDIADYQLKVSFLTDDGIAISEEVVVHKTQNMVQELIYTEDANLLRIGKPIEHKCDLAVWRYQMNKTAARIEEFQSDHCETLTVIDIGLRRVIAFMNGGYERRGITREEWRYFEALVEPGGSV